MRLSARLISEQIKDLKLPLKISDHNSQTKMIQAILLVDRKQQVKVIKLLTDLGRDRSFKSALGM